jgi:Zn-dependent M28 family amino/carboxypeptidase
MNTTNNESKGALDNASGVTCLLELLNYYRCDNFDHQSLSNLNIWFLFTGAEECGTNGAKNFQNSIKGINKKRFVFINVDSVGRNIDLIKFGLTSHYRCKIKKYFQINAKKHGLKVLSRKVPVGVHTDGYIFFKKGYKGIEIGDWSCYEYLHTPEDTIDKIDPKNLQNVCEIIIDTLDDYNEFLNQ